MRLTDSLSSGTPLANRLLIAAWDDLSVETKAEIIYNSPRAALCSKDVQQKMLSDSSPLIRYLVVTNPSFDKAGFEDQVEGDSFDLVRSTSFKAHDSPSIQEWKALTHLERLHAITLNECCWAEGFAQFIRESVGTIPNGELTELLVEYCKSKHAKGHAVDWATLSQIWNLVNELPPGVSEPILSHFPTESDRGTPVSDEILATLNEASLYVLLNRDDVSLLKFRKQLEQSEDMDKYGEMARRANQFWLSKRPEINEDEES